MADIEAKQFRGETPEEMLFKYKDMGDGTHAWVVYIGGQELTVTGVVEVDGTVEVTGTVTANESSGDGVIDTPGDTPINVTTTSALCLAAKANRVQALFVNDSDTTIYLRRGAGAAVNQGIRLNVNGGAYEMSQKLGNLYRGPIYAIHGGAGTKRLLVNDGH